MSSKPSTFRNVVNYTLLLLRNLLIASLALALGLALGISLADRQVTWPITLAGLSFYALVIVSNPLAGLLFWVVTAPFSRFVYLDLIVSPSLPALTLSRMCAGFMLLLVVAQMANGRIRFFRPIRLDGAIVATLLAIAASLPASLQGFQWALVSFFDTYFIPFVVYLLARALVRARQQAEHVASGLIILGTILTTSALQEQLSGTVIFSYTERSWVYTKDIHKLAGLLGSPAFFATLITMGSVFAVYRLTRAQTFKREALYTLLAAYMAVGVFFTYNRGGYLGLAIDMAIMAVAWPRFRRLFVVAVLVGGMAIVLSWNTVQQSAVVTERLQARGPIAYRLEIWSRASQILLSSPIFGLGFFNFGPTYLRYNPAWVEGIVLPAPHNSLLEVTFDSGLIAGIPYLVTILIVAVSAARFYRRARDSVDGEDALVLAFALALLAYLVQAMVIDMVAAYYVNTVMMLALGALFGWQSERDHASRHPGTVSN